jgi:nucleoside diphosphate kinase
MNAFHGSDGPVSASTELTFFFSPPESSTPFTLVPLEASSTPSKGFIQKTLAVIKPDATAALEEIIPKIIYRGFSVQKREEIILNTERAQELSAAFEGTLEYEESVAAITRYRNTRVIS